MMMIVYQIAFLYSLTPHFIPFRTVEAVAVPFDDIAPDYIEEEEN